MSDARSYYGQPVIKEPVWTPEIPLYFFTGGLAGASAGLAWLGECAGDDELSRRAWVIALGAVGASPALLISDLGVPARFLNMLRMFKVTSPMSVGSWVLSASGLTTAVAAGNALTGLLPGAARVCKPAAALLGLPLSTYTAVLIAQTAVPVWHEARRDLPFVFAAGAAMSAGAAATMAVPPARAVPARRLTVLGAVGEVGGMLAMEQRLGSLGEPYAKGAAAAFKRAGTALTLGGALAVAGPARRSRLAALAGGAAVLAGAVCTRFSVFKAGFQSAAEARYTVGPQRERLAARA
jgi:formate-dependent nitrite reductase membrane component NrfD